EMTTSYDPSGVEHSYSSAIDPVVVTAFCMRTYPRLDPEGVAAGACFFPDASESPLTDHGPHYEKWKLDRGEQTTEWMFRA
ncbi:MAG: hypothetical protein ABIY71_07130, partial [Flavobacteriales bacterium]